MLQHVVWPDRAQVSVDGMQRPEERRTNERTQHNKAGFLVRRSGPDNFIWVNIAREDYNGCTADLSKGQAPRSQVRLMIPLMPSSRSKTNGKGLHYACMILGA